MDDVNERAAKMFAVNTAKHQLTILHNDGLYRHVRFGRPDTSLYRYELVTWPGHLSVGGDHRVGDRGALERVEPFAQRRGFALDRCPLIQPEADALRGLFQLQHVARPGSQRKSMGMVG